MVIGVPQDGHLCPGPGGWLPGSRTDTRPQVCHIHRTNSVRPSPVHLRYLSTGFCQTNGDQSSCKWMGSITTELGRARGQGEPGIGSEGGGHPLPVGIALGMGQGVGAGRNRMYASLGEDAPVASEGTAGGGAGPRDRRRAVPVASRACKRPTTGSVMWGRGRIRWVTTPGDGEGGCNRRHASRGAKRRPVKYDGPDQRQTRVVGTPMWWDRTHKV